MRESSASPSHNAFLSKSDLRSFMWFMTHSPSKYEHCNMSELDLDINPNTRPISQPVCNTLHASCTINTNDLAVNPLTILRGKEGSNTSYIDRHANSVHG